MKRQPKHLTLRRDTIRQLTAAERAAIIGGYQPRDSGVDRPARNCPSDSVTSTR